MLVRYMIHENIKLSFYSLASYIWTENTGITAFDITISGKFFIKYLNDFSHLEEVNLMPPIIPAPQN